MISQVVVKDMPAEDRELSLAQAKVQANVVRYERHDTTLALLRVRGKRRVSDVVWDDIINPERPLMDNQAIY